MITGFVFLILSPKWPEKNSMACVEYVSIAMMGGNIADPQPEFKILLMDVILAMPKPQLGALTISLILALSQGDTDFSRPLPGDSS